MQARQTFFLLFFSVFFFSLHCLAQDSTRYLIHFNSGHSDLSSSSKSQLKHIIDSLVATNKKFSIDIVGAADDQGPEDLNNRLSEKRANAVKNFMIASGVNGIDINTEFIGESSPVASNTTKQGRSLNRRAEIIVNEIKEVVVEKPVPVEDEPQGDIRELYALLRSPAQEFCIDLTRDTLLVGERGTIIQYKANTIKKDNLSCKCFTLTLNEYYDNSEFIMNNLTTTSDGNLLESGGMIKLDGYCDGKKYELKPGEYFTVMVPTDTVLPGMKLLSANRDNDSSYLNWQVDRSSEVLDTFDWKRMMMFCAGVKRDASAKCHLFFCKIKRFFAGLFGKPYQSKTDKAVNELVKNEKEFVEKYSLKGEELAVALEKSKDNSGKEALKYYVYKNSSWDYRNIDRLKRIGRLTNFIVHNKPEPASDVKIVFKVSKTVVPSFEKSNSYLFKQLADGAEVWVVGLRYTEAKEIFLGLKEINTSEKSTTLEFRQVSVDELKTLLQQVNKR